MSMDKTFNAAKAETRLYEAWEAAGCFKAGANARPGAPKFSIMIPPPNVTGSLHMGHAFNNTLQDILVRWHRMQGHDTLWQPGQDHAGIATQMVVERKLAEEGKPSRREMGREKFLEKVWDWKQESGGTIINQLKRLGASCDWSRNAFTMSGAPGAPEGEDGNFHDAVIKVFVDMYEKGLIYRGKRLVNWDPHFETAISDLEVENIETAGHMWHFKYPLADGVTYRFVERDEDGKIILEEERDYISIATTRPETMLGDGAIAVHPSDERYASIVGKLCEIPVGPKDHRRLIPIITDSYPDPAFGSGAVKITGAHDFNDYAVAERNGIPMYRLMGTNAHLREDGAPYAECAARAQAIAKGAQFDEGEIDTLNLVPDDLRGLDRFEARRLIVDQITDEGLAVMTDANDPRLGKSKDDAEGLVPLIEAKPIMQPFGDRSKVVIEPMLTDQWFVDTARIVEPALDAVRKGREAGGTDILPESDRKVYFHWLENIEPWCISRQLWWGHQIPVWYGLNLEFMQQNLAAEGLAPDSPFEDWDGIDIGTALALDALVQHGNHARCSTSFDDVVAQFQSDISGLPAPLNHARVIEVADRDAAVRALAGSLASFSVDQDPTKLVYPVWRDPDVLDTWFSSGLWPIGTLGWPNQTPELQRYFPTDVLITGFDIIFFWVARMMMMQYAVVGERPFDTVYVHALVRDEKGKKMSKSLGNVLDPLELIDDYGTDAVRFTLAAMAAMGRDLKLSKDRIAGYRNFGTKLWNAMRFAEMNGVFEARNVDLATLQDDMPRQTVNRWILGEVATVRETVDVALNQFRFNDAANTLYAFVWGKVCDWYVEFAKPLLAEGHEARSETQVVMKWVLDQCLVMLHPIMPFITEELWGLSGERVKMLIHTNWPEYTSAELLDPQAQREMNWVISVIENTRSARAQMHVPAGLYVPMLTTEIGPEGRDAWSRNETLIKRLARIESLEEVSAFPKGTITISADGAILGMPLAEIIDVAEEKARLEKSIAKLDKEIKGLSGRVNNPKFAESAPPEVVAETKENLTQREEERRTLANALARLAEIG
ncbi:valyl-tRNA synthetase [Poseidonocella pacifica]|uniref:Valine--tRNA ligase n=1 Tax=Poseidonocella pacifica TaxID=871651 RepID=A0A1I0WBM4_9RHOB|nr:valine--tRNA ligase [Poseidonocella pacifica]SFA85306.1 valyl-tRNA synthetase [Poseidonocella pacifica]